ncbi:MAG: Transposase [Candidatus Midichloria mitochondrii]
MQEKLDKSCNGTKSLKDIEVLEIDELYTYIKKKTKEWKWEYTFILIAVDRGAGEIIDFEGRWRREQGNLPEPVI